MSLRCGFEWSPGSRSLVIVLGYSVRDSVCVCIIRHVYRLTVDSPLSIHNCLATERLLKLAVDWFLFAVWIQFYLAVIIEIVTMSYMPYTLCYSMWMVGVSVERQQAAADKPKTILVQITEGQWGIRQTIEMARFGSWFDVASRARGNERVVRGIAASLSRAPPTSLDVRPARSAALINKLTVKYLRSIGEASTILLEPLSSYWPVRVQLWRLFIAVFYV